MNILLWVLQVFLALHTGMGAIWKFTNPPEKAVPSLKAIPRGAWLGLSVVELACAVGLVLVALVASAGGLVPIAAAVVAAEMLLFCAIHLRSGGKNHGLMMYWLVVAAVCAFLAYGRYAIQPL